MSIRSVVTRLSHRRSSGVTLIELVIVIAMLGAGAASILPFFQQSAQSISINQTMQTGIQLARECAEHVIVSRRKSSIGYIGIDNTICDVIPAFNSYTRTVTVTPVTSATVALCPLNAACKKVDIVVNQAGANATSISMLLTDY